MRLEAGNQSCLPAFCLTCFDRNVAKNCSQEKRELRESLKVKPQCLSWCSWFQKIASSVGLEFDGEVILGREALEKWKGMSEEERLLWKQSYNDWALEPATPAPKNKKDKSDAQSPETAEKTDAPAKRLPDMSGPQPLHDKRVESLKAFHQRWAWLQKKMGAQPTSSFFLKNSQQFHEMYLDVLALLKLGCFNSA